MKNTAAPSGSGKISFKEKYSFGLGAIGKDMVYGIIATFSMIYLTDQVGLNAAFVGTMFFAAKFWDAINDFFMGMIIDNTHSRWGKFKPYLIAFAVPATMMTCLYWMAPLFFGTDPKDLGKFFFCFT